MANGAIWLSRSIWDNPIVTKDPDHLAVWIWLLTNAVWKEKDVMFGGKRTTLSPGQLTCGRRQIAAETGVQEDKVFRILKLFKSEQQIAQRTDHQSSLISIVNWLKYQKSAQGNAQRLHNDCTTIAQRLHTKEESNKEKKEKKDIYISDHSDVVEIVDYLNSRCGTHYKASTRATTERIKARMNEGFTLDDFRRVIDVKATEWLGSDMEKYLRPETLFGTKFENYLNQKPERKKTGNAFLDLLNGGKQ